MTDGLLLNVVTLNSIVLQIRVGFSFIQMEISAGKVPKKV
jgi:hypothetical protein